MCVCVFDFRSVCVYDCVCVCVLCVCVYVCVKMGVKKSE